MGDARTFSNGRKPLNNAGLEFAGTRKSRFAQYTHPQARQVAVPQKQQSPAQQTPMQYQQAPATVAHVQYQQQPEPFVPPTYQEIPHTQVLYPHQLSPIDTIEVPVLPEDDVTAELAFDVGDALDENDEFFDDMPKSKIMRPTEGLKEEVKSKRKKGFKLIMATLGLAAGVGVLFVSYTLIQRYSPAVSTAMRKKVGYPVFQLQPTNAFAVDRKSVEINENESLVYKVKDTATDGNFVFSQQKLPDIVKGDDNYQQFLTQTEKFASFETPLGKAYLTRPQGIGSDVSVVLKTDSTLLFIRGNGETSEQTWAQLVGSLKIQ